MIDDKGELALSTWQLEGKVGGEDGIIILVTSSLESGGGAGRGGGIEEVSGTGQPGGCSNSLSFGEEQPVTGQQGRLDQGHQVAGRYQVARLLGAGEVGEVYDVRDMTTGYAYALKLLRPELTQNPDAWSALCADAQNASALESESDRKSLRVSDGAVSQRALRAR